jgi:hypothetical protein
MDDNRAMHNVLLILLHRPFVSDGHLYSNRSAAKSFSVCATAATAIIHVLRAYNETFSIRRAPYLISYATYVAATIHVRIAAQGFPEAHTCLATCLDIFKKNQDTNWAVRRASLVIKNLMKRMQVVIKDDERTFDPSLKTAESGTITGVSSSEAASHGRSIATSGDINGTSVLNVIPSGVDSSIGAAARNFDIDAIISSFTCEEPGDPKSQLARNGPGYSNNGPCYPSAPLTPYGVQPSSEWSSSGTPDGAIPYAEQGTFGSDFQNVETFHGDLSVNDMLFGFNSSAVDGIGWEFEGRSV